MTWGAIKPFLMKNPLIDSIPLISYTFLDLGSFWVAPPLFSMIFLDTFYAVLYIVLTLLEGAFVRVNGGEFFKILKNKCCLASQDPMMHRVEDLESIG